MSKVRLLLVWSVALAAWAGVGYGLVAREVGAIPELLHPLRLGYYALVVVAPALTFFPLARLMRLTAFGFEATFFWAGLLLMLTFVSPNSTGMPAYMLFLILLFGAVAAVFVPLNYAVGARLLTLRVHRRDTGRARREAYLIGLFIALSAAMNMGGFYNALNALLLLLILALVESFALARKPSAEPIE